MIVIGNSGMRIASMGPRSQKRGNIASGKINGSSYNASMGPRSQKRGNSGSDLRNSNLSGSLQWGRAHRSAETKPHFPNLERRNYCFNGAALTEARKHRDNVVEASHGG